MLVEPIESPSSCAAEISVISLGRPSITERRDRAVFDINKAGVFIRGDVEVFVTATVRSKRYLTNLFADLDEVKAILRAAVQTGAIDSIDSIKAFTINRAYNDGIDSIYVAIRPVADHGIMLA